jgi:solute carrier family 25 protein 33/36
LNVTDLKIIVFSILSYSAPFYLCIYLSLLSGGVAGTIASCITNPLEVIKTQLQSSSVSKAAHGEMATAGGHPIVVAQRIFAKNGILGFYKGLKPTLIGIIPARSIYFYSYQQAKEFLGKTILPEGSVGNALVSGFAAGIASNTLTNPIWMVKTRFQLLADSTAGQKAYVNYGDAINTIMKEEGIGGFYKGLSASYWGCTEGAIQFLLYEKLKTRLLRIENEKRSALGLVPTQKLSKKTYFFSAAVAKGAASIITYPHEVARTRLREQARDGIFKYKNMWQTIGLVAKEEGCRGLYSGMGVHLAKVVPNSAIMFLTYELVNSWLSSHTAV